MVTHMFRVLLASFLAIPGLSAWEQFEGELGQSKYTIVIPDSWNGKLAVYNHGYIPEENSIQAYLPVRREPYKTLLESGWALAASSYRRNGIIVKDATEDVIQLIRHFSNTFKAPDSLLLIGSSMGGAVTLRMVEAAPGRFAGALILGRGLDLIEPDASSAPLTFRPETPILLLTNSDETQAPAAYKKQVLKEQPDAPIALWIVETPGHILFTSEEILAATQALLEMVAGKPVEPFRKFSIPALEPTSIAQLNKNGRSARSEVIDISPTYGNLDVFITPGDLKAMGIAQGDIFEFTTRDQTYKVKWATSYSEVARGEWVAFINEFKRLQVAINRGSAARVADLSIGDPVTVRAISK